MKIEEMIAAKRADCSGCEACANICPKNAIEMVRDAEGFAYPKINHELCIKCGRCDATCPALNFKPKTIEALPPTFTAIYDNDKVLRHSSSGGMFTALSEIIFNDGGIVFGAGFDKNWHIVHSAAKNFDELENLRGSKYVQSQIGDVYRQVRDALKSKKVLFSGTPCQCAGLKHFLGGDHENLLTVGIICHSTPSPKLWESYIDDIGYAHEITNINFRNKGRGWGYSLMYINFSDKERVFSTLSNNPYSKLFLRSMSLRPSCSICKFRFPNVQSDLTIGDAWGVNDFSPDMFDARGVSVVFLHTDKGREFFERLNLKVKPVRFVDAVRKNKFFIIPTVVDSRRKKFFAELAKSNDWLTVMQKYFTQDETEFRKEIGKKTGAIFAKSLQAILDPIRQSFPKKILVVSSVRDREGQESLANFLKQSIKKSALYFLQPKENGQFICKEDFSGANFEFKDVNALNEFVKRFGIAKVRVEKELNFGDNTAAVNEWLKTCGLPTKLFVQKN